MKCRIEITTNNLDLLVNLEELLARFWGQKIFHEIVLDVTSRAFHKTKNVLFIG